MFKRKTKKATDSFASFRQAVNETLGTYSGGSPRFSSHPTLEQVFAGAKEVDPELEEAFW